MLWNLQGVLIVQTHDMFSLYSHFNKVVGTGDFRVVFNVKGVIKLQSDLKTLLQLNAIRAVRAFGVRFREIRTGNLSGPLRIHTVITLHCNDYKHTHTRLSFQYPSAFKIQQLKEECTHMNSDHKQLNLLPTLSLQLKYIYIFSNIYFFALKHMEAVMLAPFFNRVFEVHKLIHISLTITM